MKNDVTDILLSIENHENSRRYTCEGKPGKNF